MRRVVTITAALCLSFGLVTVPAHALDEHGGPSGAAGQYPFWYTASGVKAPESVIRSAHALRHCWPHVTLLQIANTGGVDGGPQPGDAARMYVLDPEGEYHARFMDGTYAARVDMPYDAVDTGLSQDGQDLWLARDGRAAYLVGEHGVQRAPAHTVTGPGCD